MKCWRPLVSDRSAWLRSVAVAGKKRNVFGRCDRDPGRAAIAQLVEHLIRNEGVGGSNPSCGTKEINDLEKT